MVWVMMTQDYPTLLPTRPCNLLLRHSRSALSHQRFDERATSGYGFSPSRCKTRTPCCDWLDVGSPGSRATSFHTSQVLRPRPGARAHAPVRVAFRFRNGVGTRDINLCEAQWLAFVLPYRRFAAALTGDRARLGADVVRY